MAEVVLATRVAGTARYAYLPFDVPAGTTRLEVSLRSERPARLGLGLFDPRGPGERSAGFRGLAGAERRDVVLAPDAATPGFVPGSIDPGRWTVVVPVFLAPPTRVEVRVRMTSGPAGAVCDPEPAPDVVRAASGWYRGDLHCHTLHSSDAWSSGSALDPAGWAAAARAHGLDFLAMTDHNVVSQNWALRSSSGPPGGDGVLLIAGEEMTNYWHGHATVSGLEPGEWVDFRQSPFGLALPTGGQRLRDLLAVTRSMGAYVSAAHPFVPTQCWQLLADGWRDPTARTDGLEVWHGRWDATDEAALAVWHELLRRGWDVVANGGSDLHGLAVARTGVGRPTTVVHAAALSRDAVLAAVRGGRGFVTSAPDGVEVYLEVDGPGGQSTFSGGRIWGGDGDAVQVRALVRRGAGLRLRLLTEAGLVSERVLASDDELVRVPARIGRRHGFVRAEVRGRLGGALRRVGPAPMHAFSNPVRLLVGDPPPGVAVELAPPPPA